ncbi:MAG: DUF72 domain-containing protein [Myxococcota bacterium]|nr:DUF72 domain-containing protein [Myxococcota bacterium]
MGGQFYLGCAVWAYRPWIGEFYPHGASQDKLLELYAQRLTCVEGNTTFYALPPEDNVEKWASQMPPGFKFCPKLARRVTHEGKLTDGQTYTELFLERMTGFGDNLGPVLVQLPPTFGPAQFHELKQYLKWWPHDEFPMALEVRHEGWWLDAPARGLNELLVDCGASRVLLDTRPIYSGQDDPQSENPRKKPEIPVHPVVTNNTAFVRYIQHPVAKRNEEYTRQWSDQVDAWLRDEVEVYFFSHCPIEDHSPAFARDFQRSLEALDAPVPPLPWDDVKDPPKQLGLF